jgi:TIR domain
VKVFISYSRIDAKETENVIHNYLTEYGHHEVFIDTSNIPYGGDWNEVIQKEISNCDIFIMATKFLETRVSMFIDILWSINDETTFNFSINIGFEKMKHNPQAITTAMQLYFNGESLSNTQRSLKLLGVQVSHQTVYNWIEKYIGLMKKYVEKLKPNVGDT